RGPQCAFGAPYPLPFLPPLPKCPFRVSPQIPRFSKFFHRFLAGLKASHRVPQDPKSAMAPVPPESRCCWYHSVTWVPVTAVPLLLPLCHVPL
ncbi:unnamed protein product, partial [Staurois parvus]